MIWNKTTPGSEGERWFWPAWAVAFVGFPIGGSAAYLLAQSAGTRAPATRLADDRGTTS